MVTVMGDHDHGHDYGHEYGHDYGHDHGNGDGRLKRNWNETGTVCDCHIIVTSRFRLKTKDLL
jgi:hypothetical protein